MVSQTQKKVARFFSRYKRLTYKKGAMVLRAEETPPGVLYLSKGYVREYVISHEGVELTLHFFKPRTFFPLTWVLNNTDNTQNYEAVTTSVIWCAPREKVMDFISREPDILLDLNKRFLAGIQGLLSRIQYLVFGTATTRVAATLVFLAKHFGEIVDNHIILNNRFTHREIAAFAAVTRETVSRQIEELKKKGIIVSMNQTLVITDILYLESLLPSSYRQQPTPIL